MITQMFPRNFLPLSFWDFQRTVCQFANSKATKNLGRTSAIKQDPLKVLSPLNLYSVLQLKTMETDRIYLWKRKKLLPYQVNWNCTLWCIVRNLIQSIIKPTDCVHRRLTGNRFRQRDYVWSYDCVWMTWNCMWHQYRISSLNKTSEDWNVKTVDNSGFCRSKRGSCHISNVSSFMNKVFAIGSTQVLKCTSINVMNDSIHTIHCRIT